MMRSLLGSSCLCVLLFAVAASAQAASVVGGQGIISSSDAATLSSWLGEGQLQLTCIFSRNAGDGKTSVDFHAASDLKSRTFLVMEATPSGGQTKVVGGYNPRSWDASIADYVNTPALSDRTAFIFNLSTNRKLGQRIDSVVGQFQTYNRSSYGPTFGGGHDIYVSGDFLSSYSYGYSYRDGTGVDVLGGSFTSFAIGRLDVFTIAPAPVPEPSSILALLFGVGGMGGMIWRRRSA